MIILDKNAAIATDGITTLVVYLTPVEMEKYSGNNAREVTKGSDDELVFEDIYGDTKTTYKLSHHLNILGKPIFFINEIRKEPISKTTPSRIFTNVEATVMC